MKNFWNKLKKLNQGKPITEEEQKEQQERQNAEWNVFAESKLCQWMGAIFRIIVIIIFGTISYLIIKPEFNILELPFSELTLGDVLRGILSVAIILFFAWWLFNPQKEDDAFPNKPYTLWGLYAAIILLIGFVGGIILLLMHYR